MFKRRMETFVHVITRESKYKNKREFDRDRANRIHWIRPILENSHLSCINVFERVNDKGENQHYYWCPKKDFVVILREIKPDLMLLTAFCVDDYNKNKFRNWYNEFHGHKKTPLRK